MSLPESREGRVPRQERIEMSSRDGRVHVRQYVASDAQPAFDLIQRNKEHLLQFGDETGSKYKDADAFERSITDPDDPARLRFGIWNDQDQLVGSVNITPAVSDASVGVIGYYLGKEFVGHGYTQTAVDTLTEYAFSNLGFQSVDAVVHRDNMRSSMVLHGAGYQFQLGSDFEEYILFSRHT